MNNIYILFFISLMVSSCFTMSINYEKYTGEEINKKFKKIQESTLDFEAENDGAIYEDNISIYKIDKKLCVIISKIDGDSGVYGTERILYFNNLKYRSGYLNTFAYVFLNNDESKRTNKTKYIERINDSEVQKELNKDFMNYRKFLKESTLKSCS
ncbi:hypothetical protein [Acinetobacter sp. WZC-1]|uniref:hypothetical protein n=1 Tax=Acinetobacter sp. WZC-1 TaxID=3459034 RepID=UPI00403D7183